MIKTLKWIYNLGYTTGFADGYQTAIDKARADKAFMAMMEKED